MNIKIEGSSMTYALSIHYHFKCLDGRAVKIFTTFGEFEGFMHECHPDIDYSDVTLKFTKRLEMLTKMGEQGGVQNQFLVNQVHCFISGDSLVCCYSETGMLEKLYEHYTMSEKINNGYLHTFLAHSWEFGRKGSQSYVKYWFDKNNKNETVYKLHCFKNKIVFERPDGTISSMIVNDDYYIHFEGVKRPEKKA